MARKLTSMENDQYTLWNWSKARKLKITENEKYTL